MSNYDLWLEYAKENDPEMYKGLKNQSEKEREEAFHGNMEFGTGGMRGIMGYGTNRYNTYTIRRANFGLGKYLLKTWKDQVSRGVVISHDGRHHSRDYAFESARVLGALGIKCFMFDGIRTTPELSFSVRQLGCIAGIMITASHNPAAYNGYKVYNEKGCQYIPEFADQIVEEVNKVENIFDVPVQDKDFMLKSGMLRILPKDLDDKFIEAAKSVQLYPGMEKVIKIVYTPLHGCGAVPAKRLLAELGYDASFVEKQMITDPDFSTVKSPNPEDPASFKMAEELGFKVHGDLLIASDPDADRIGIGVWDGSKYNYLTGNQSAALLIEFRLAREKELGLLPKKGRVFNTIVTSDSGAKIAKAYGYKVTSTLTGFKWIGDAMDKAKEKDPEEEYVFGYEESYGYIVKDFVRDKDSFSALTAIGEMANWYRINENKNLMQKLDDLYEKYGWFTEVTRNHYFEGLEGPKKMAQIMDYFRNEKISTLGGYKVAVKEDVLESTRLQMSTGVKSPLNLPKSNVIKYYLAGVDAWAVLRPSGTEPKLKIYLEACDSDKEVSKSIVKALDDEFTLKIKELTGNA